MIEGVAQKWHLYLPLKSVFPQTCLFAMPPKDKKSCSMFLLWPKKLSHQEISRQLIHMYRAQDFPIPTNQHLPMNRPHLMFQKSVPRQGVARVQGKGAGFCGVFVGMSWCLLVFVSISKYLFVFVGICMCLLVLVGICW